MSHIDDGTYCIALPSDGGNMTDPGEGRYLHLLPHGQLGPDADKINIVYNKDKGAHALQFARSKKYITFAGEPSMNNKLIPGDKPRYFKIIKHEYYDDLYIILSAENKDFHVNMALERIYPPWVALNSFSDKQPWKFEKA